MTKPYHALKTVKTKNGRVSVCVFTPHKLGGYGEKVGKLRIITGGHRTSLDLTLHEAKAIANAFIEVTETW